MDHKTWLSPFHKDFWGDRFFNQMIPRSFNELFQTGNFGPAIDLRETKEEIVLYADLPGVRQEDLDLTVDENTVIIQGITQQDKFKEEKGYHLMERRYGSFYRTVPLPAAVKAEEAKATYNNGVLELHIPKMETSSRGFKPRIEPSENLKQ